MKKITTIYLNLIFLIIFSFGCSSGNDINKSPALLAKNYFDELINDDEAPSIQYIIFSLDTVLFEYQSGYADIRKEQSVYDNTDYHLFSLTKTFTALAVMQLHQKGIINIDDKAANHIIDFPYDTSITIRNLLTHSSGIPNPLPISWIHTYDEHNAFNRDDFFMTIINDNLDLDFEPNDEYQYSNLGYYFLGKLIEDVTSMKYEDYIRENIFSKTNKDKAKLSFAIDTTNHAIGYQKTFSVLNVFLGFVIDKDKYMGESINGWKPFQYFYLNGASYGGLIGNKYGLMNYLRELLDPESTIIESEFKKQLYKLNITNDDDNDMCLSWFKSELNGNRYYTHAGGGGGYYSEIRLYPELNLGSVLIMNRTGVSDDRMLDDIDILFIDEKRELSH